MKKVVIWFFGDRAGRTLIGTWNWFWGRPLEAGNKLTVEVAQAALVDMQASVAKLAESVAKIQGSYQQAKAKYDHKLVEHQRLEAKAQLAQHHGNEAAARMAISQTIVLEKLLPQLEDQVQQAEQILHHNKERLTRERQRLETFKAEMQNMRDLAEVNEALGAIASVNNDIGADSARIQFTEAQNAIQGRYRQEQALAELTEDPAEQLAADLEQLTLEDEISRRLSQLKPADIPTPLEKAHDN
ncbi:MAG: PspA/IM30 family protein [Cyanobacteria bacterium P01_F01_bin.13]